jgi:hypothetical protein
MDAGESTVKHTARLIASGIALAVNAAALAMLNTAMLAGAEKDRLSLQEPVRVVISAPRVATGSEQPTLSAVNCSPTRL